MTSETDHILTMKNMTVAFGGVRACDNIDCEVERGELFALIGPNGAGKTTLINAVTGIYVPEPGVVGLALGVLYIMMTRPKAPC